MVTIQENLPVGADPDSRRVAALTIRSAGSFRSIPSRDQSRPSDCCDYAIPFFLSSLERFAPRMPQVFARIEEVRRSGQGRNSAHSVASVAIAGRGRRCIAT